MKTPAIPHGKTSRAKATDKAAPSKSKRRLTRNAANVLAPKTGVIARQVPLLLERFPHAEQKRICLGLYAPEAQAVFVAGTFNGWQPSAKPLQKQNDGRWVVELVLEPGRYEYRFVVDGQWTDDPLSPAYVSNPFGGLNCVLVAAIQGMS
jgi:5'-AMP-activated protein kinase regulatory beta subunit